MSGITVLSKTITAFVTSVVMLWLRSRFHIEDLDVSANLQTLISVVSDITISGVVAFFVWFIPLGKSYVEQRIMGQHVVIKNLVTGVETVGEVTQVIGPPPFQGVNKP